MRRIALVLMAAPFVVVTVLATGSASLAQDPEEEKKEAVEAKKQEGQENPVAKEEEKEAQKGIGDPAEEKREATQAPPEKKAEEEKEAKKAEEEKEAKKADMPKTGGIITPYNAAFLALGATALLVAGGLLVRRLAR
jgi:chromatin segregation and condensation protein Rec8/ScpA/Scc1 (kleisin family)